MNTQMSLQSQTVVLKADGTNNGASAGTSALTTDALDMQNAESAAIVYLLGTVTSTGTGSLQVQHSDATGSGWANIGPAITYADTDSGKAIVIDVGPITKRYVRIVNTRATANSVITSVVARIFGLRNAPRSVHSTVLSRTVIIP